MAAAQFVFLERNMEKDKESFDYAIDYYKGTGKSYQVLYCSCLEIYWLSISVASLSRRNRQISMDYNKKSRVRQAKRTPGAETSALSED